jgi:hypothetical protein
MRLFIPPLGTVVRLTSAWTCTIHREGRNWDVRRALVAHAQGETGAQPPTGDWWARYSAQSNDRDGSLSMTLPEGTVLKVDRIYVRSGQGDFDSVTFLIKDSPDKRFVGKKGKGTFDGKPRFWVKLHEANAIECEIVEDAA